MGSLIMKSLLLAAATASTFAALSANAAELGPKTSQADGVAIQVTPIDVAATASGWKFAVALNTHSQNLADDVATEAFILDAAGKPRRALGWEGDPPGGHHRRGVLSFAPMSPSPALIDLRIQRATETAPRTFRWTVK